MNIKEKYKQVLNSSTTDCIIGKQGIDGNVGYITHVKNLLKKHRIIKIKVLKSALTDSTLQELAQKLAEQTNSYLLDIRGKKFILSKKPVDI
ncbi:MAG: YhbY family RNA-binding protein [Candidatus Lokiarchaeota archaeon]